MKKEKLRLIIIVLVTVALLATASLYGFIEISKREIKPGSLIALLIPLLAVGFMAFFILRRYRDIKHGMPMEDERSRKVITQAAAKSFYFSLYWLLFISWFESFFASKLFGVQHLDASQTVGGGIAGMAVFFFILWVYYDRKGKLI